MKLSTLPAIMYTLQGVSGQATSPPKSVPLLPAGCGPAFFPDDHIKDGCITEGGYEKLVESMQSAFGTLITSENITIYGKPWSEVVEPLINTTGFNGNRFLKQHLNDIKSTFTTCLHQRPVEYMPIGNIDKRVVFAFAKKIAGTVMRRIPLPLKLAENGKCNANNELNKKVNQREFACAIRNNGRDKQAFPCIGFPSMKSVIISGQEPVRHEDSTIDYKDFLLIATFVIVGLIRSIEDGLFVTASDYLATATD